MLAASVASTSRVPLVVMSTEQSTWVALVCVQTRFVGVAEPLTLTAAARMSLSTTWMWVSEIVVFERWVGALIEMFGEKGSIS